MGHAQQMLTTFPQDGLRQSHIDVRRFAETIETLIDCSNTCTLCADACLLEPDMASLSHCIRLNLDCADICTATSRVIARLPEMDAPMMRPLLEACRAACEACGQECASHASHMEHCRVCSEQCRRCAAACQELLVALGE